MTGSLLHGLLAAPVGAAMLALMGAASMVATPTDDPQIGYAGLRSTAPAFAFGLLHAVMAAAVDSRAPLGWAGPMIGESFDPDTGGQR